MEVMDGHFIGKDSPDEWADLLVVWCVGMVWSALPTQFCLTNEKIASTTTVEWKLHYVYK